MKRFLLLLLVGFFAIPFPVAAQKVTSETPKVEPDRRDFTTGTSIVPKGYLQLEAGATMLRSGDERDYSFGEALLRVPLAERAELRLSVPSYLVQRVGERASGADDAMLEARVSLLKRARRSVALQLGSVLPTGSRRVAEHRYQPRAVLAVNFKLAEKSELVFNLGGQRASDNGQRFTQGFIASSLRYDLTERWNVFAEAYAFNRQTEGGPTQKYIALGAVYFPNRHTAFDARFGSGLGNKVGGPNFFYSAGISRLF